MSHLKLQYGIISKHYCNFTLKLSGTVCSRGHSKIFIVLCFRENNSLHFLLIICLADDSHKMSRLDFSEEKKKKKKMSAAVVIGALRVNHTLLLYD